MTWDGWFQYDGNEVVNVARTEAYVRNAGYGWFRPQYHAQALPLMLGDGREYRTPLQDDAPWVDDDQIESVDFYGMYPLGVTGFEDSSRTSTTVESLSDGGTPGRLRNTIKTLTFNGVLLAGNDKAADYGIKWLRKALLGGVCGPRTDQACNGAELCYLSSEPEMENLDRYPKVAAQIDGGWFQSTDQILAEPTDGGSPDSVYSTEVDGDIVGTAYDLSVDGGEPNVLGSATGVEMIEVDIPVFDGGGVTRLPNLTFDGGTPWVTGGVIDANVAPFNFEEPTTDPTDCLPPLLRSLRKVLFNNGPEVTAKKVTSDGACIWSVQFTAVAGNPYELGVEMPVIEGFLDPTIPVPWAGGVEPPGAAIDLDGYIYTEAACAVPTFRAIYDPNNPAMIEPPGPPNVPLGGYVAPLNWRRRQITVPKQFVPLWGDVVPKIAVSASTQDVRNLRLRFYVDPYNIGDITEDPCAYCGDIVVSYVPKGHTLILDGAEETVYIISPGGGRHRADSLVFKTDGTPFEWPALSCGYGYVVTFDLPQTQPPPYVDLSLFARAV